MRILLLNGPPSSGKDTLGEMICNRFQSSAFHIERYKMSQPIKDAIVAMTGCTFEYLEEHKDKPCPELMGKTFREVQISLSENWFKVLWGQQVFGDIAVHRIRQIRADVVVITDSGFTDEARPIVRMFENVSCVRIERKGCAFKTDKVTDSRDWLDCYELGIQSVTLLNNGTKQELFEVFEGMNQGMRFI